MDDIILDDRQWPLVVAGVDLRLDRIRNCRLLHLHHRSYRGSLPHRFPCRRTIFIRHLGKFVAGL